MLENWGRLRRMGRLDAICYLGESHFSHSICALRRKIQPRLNSIKSLASSAPPSFPVTVCLFHSQRTKLTVVGEDEISRHHFSLFCFILASLFTFQKVSAKQLYLMVDGSTISLYLYCNFFLFRISNSAAINSNLDNSFFQRGEFLSV